MMNTTTNSATMADMNPMGVYVDKSTIHGCGLFARRGFNAGELIGVVKTAPASSDGPYVLWLTQRRAVEVLCDLKYINHSPEPNACYYDTHEVIAMRNILAGEEITHNYSAK